MRVLEILGAPDGTPCDPRPLLLAAALSGRFASAVLPRELEWARAGYAHCLPAPPEGVEGDVAVPALSLYRPEHLTVLADGQPFPWELRPASALTAYHWYHDSVSLPQLAAGPVAFGGPQAAPGVPLTRPREGRALWLEVLFLEHAGPRLVACARTAFGLEVREVLPNGPVDADLRPGRFDVSVDPSPHAAFHLASAAEDAVKAVAGGRWADLVTAVNAAWGLERQAGGSLAADLAVAAALEEAPGKRAARPTPDGLLVLTA